MDNQKIGRFIAKKRKELGMTQQELADQLLVTNKAISKWETGAGIPDISMLKDLSRILKITIDELLDGEEHQERLFENKLERYTFSTTKNICCCYLKDKFYQKKIYIILIEIIGSFMLTGGYAVKSAYRYVGHYTHIIGLLLMVIGMMIMICPYLFYKICCYIYPRKEYQYQFENDGIIYNDSGKEVFHPFQYIKICYLFNEFCILIFGNEKLWIKKEHYEMIKHRLNCLKKETVHPFAFSQIFGITFFIDLFFQLAVLELGYLIVMKSLGFEWIWSQLEWIVIGGMGVCLIWGVLLKHKKLSQRHLIYMSMITVLFLICVWIVGGRTSQERTIHSFSQSLSHQLVLKQDKENGEITDYHYSFLCFSKKTSTFHASVNGDIQTKWITSDCNLVQYRDHQGVKQIFVATYGERGSGISYYNVVGSMSGNWITKYNQDESYIVDVVNGSISVSRGNETRSYSPYEIQQNGTITVTLFRNNQPEYVIVMNENCELNQDNLIKNDGTLTIIPLTDGKQVPVELFCTTHKSDPKEEKTIEEQKREEATAIIQEMQDIIKNDPTLEKFSDQDDMFKIDTESTDYFEIVRQAYLKNVSKNDSDYSEEGQIQTITIPAGTIQDFYAEVKAEMILYLGGKQVTDLTGYEPVYRIMKAEKGYLVCRISPVIPGNIGLANHETPLTKDVSQDQNYHYRED